MTLDKLQTIADITTVLCRTHTHKKVEQEMKIKGAIQMIELTFNQKNISFTQLEIIVTENVEKPYSLANCDSEGFVIQQTEGYYQLTELVGSIIGKVCCSIDPFETL